MNEHRPAVPVLGALVTAGSGNLRARVIETKHEPVTGVDLVVVATVTPFGIGDVIVPCGTQGTFPAAEVWYLN